MNQRTEGKCLIFILICGLVLRLAFVFLVPIWQSADEYPHFYYIQYLAEHKSFPLAQPYFPSYECFQPPLYYFIGFAFYSALPSWDGDKEEMGKETLLERQFHPPSVSNPMATFLRMISVIFGMIVIYLTYLLNKTIFPDNPEMVLGATGFVAFLPTFISNTASISNDPLAILLSVTVVFYLINQKNWNLKHVFVSGLALGLAILTKYNLLALIPILFLVLYLDSPRKAWYRFPLTMIVTILVCSFWFIRNLKVYHSILLVTPGYPPHDFLWSRGLNEILHPIRNLFWSFWAATGRIYEIHFPPGYYILLFGSLSLLAMMGLIKFLVKSIKNRKLLNSYQKKALILLAAYSAFLVAGSLYYSFSYKMVTSWGKNLFPGISAIGLFFILGLSSLSSKYKKEMIFIFVSILVLSDLILLFLYLIPYYY